MRLIGGSRALPRFLLVRCQVRDFANPFAKERAKFWTPAATLACADLGGSRGARIRLLCHARLHNSETLRRVPDITEYRARLHVMALDRYRRDDAAAINTIASGSQQRTIKAMSHRIAVS